MSTILDALKKAEQDSSPDSWTQPPWSSPQPAESVNMHRAHRWWLPIGVVVALFIAAMLWWPDRQPPPSIPEAGVKTTRPPGTAHPRPLGATIHMPPTPPALPVQSAAKPSPAAQPVSTPKTQPSSIPPEPEKAPRQSTDMLSSEPPVVASKILARSQLEDTMDPPSPKTTSAHDQKNFRRDSRIQLQALVWSPEANARFVVINNRLVKEGGQVDNIVVVEINPDDVLLSEGSDRWHEKFNLH